MTGRQKPLQYHEMISLMEIEGITIPSQRRLLRDRIHVLDQAYLQYAKITKDKKDAK